MSCYAEGFTLVNDTKGKVTNQLQKLTPIVSIKQTIASRINDGSFEVWAKENYPNDFDNGKSLFEKSEGTISKYLRHYLRSHFASVQNSTKVNQNEDRQQFTSITAKKTATIYGAYLIGKEFYRIKNLDKSERPSSKDLGKTVRESVTAQIVKEFDNRGKSYFESNPNHSSAEKYFNLEKNIDDLNNYIDELEVKIEEVTAEQNKEEFDKLNIEYEESISRLHKYYSDKRKLVYETLTNSNNITLINYANLYNIVTSNSKNITDRFGNTITLADEYFKNVYAHKSLLNIKHIFEEQTEEEKQSDESDELEDFENITEEDINMMAANWDNYVYSNYIKHFEGGIRLYLSNILKSDIPYKDYETGKGYNTENELGVALPINDKFVVTQITNGASFYSINDFIESVKKLANTVPALYGLSQLVKDMENDNQFARKIFTNFARPVIAKTLIDVNRTSDPTISQSNLTANPISKMYFDLLNVAKLTYKDVYDEKDITALNNISKENPLNQKELLITILRKYFPNLDLITLENILYNNDKSQQDLFIYNTAKTLSFFINSIKPVITAENKANKEFGFLMADYNKKLEAYRDPNNPDKKEKPVRPEYDSSYISYKSLEQPLIQLSKLLTPYFVVNTELNHLNAKGTVSSDMINESYLTNFIKQLNYAVNEPGGELKGAELLKKFLTQSNSFYYNNLLFGITDSKGNVLREGLFIRTNGKISVNPKAKDLLKTALFDGVRNRNNLSGVDYRNMTQRDYFLSMIIAYNTPININNSIEDNNLRNKMANIMLRIPSDASNNFMVTMERYDYSGVNGLYSYDGSILSNEISNILQNLEQYNGVYVGEDTDSLTGFKRKINIYDNLNEEYFTSTNDIRDNNKASEDLITSILYKGGIQGQFDVMGYTKKFDGDNVIVPIVYKKSGTDIKFVIYLKGKYDKETQTVNNAKIDKISSLAKHSQKYTGFDEFGAIVSNTKYEFNDVKDTINLFLNDNADRLTELLIKDEKLEKTLNRDSAIFLGFKNQVVGEINDIVRALDTLFKFDKTTKKYRLINSTDGLFEWKHYTGDSVIDENGHLTGKVFTPIKLFTINGVNYSVNISELLNFYGKDGLIKKDSNGYYLNIPDNSFIQSIFNKTLQLNLERNNTIIGIDNKINDIVEKWINAYDNYIKTQLLSFNSVLNNINDISYNKIVEAIYNITLAYMDFDAIFEGDSKYYKDAQTFLKRAKEVQMAGSSFSAYDFGHEIGGAIKTLKDKNNNDILVTLANAAGERTPITLNGKQLTLDTGFRAVTIKNTNRGFERATELYNEVYDENYKKFIAQGLDDKTAKSIAKETAEAIAKGYGDFIVDGQQIKGKHTKINDAQSYITIYELARRRYANGTIDEYGDLIEKLIRPEDEFNINDIDLEQLNRFIQVEKNVYYDIQYDPVTKEYYPRQIKNAEFVLIPNLLPKNSDLRILADLMIKNNINQVNTVETSKAANKNVLEFWDSKNEKNVLKEQFEENIKDDSNIEIYYYKNLHKQQDIVDHMVDKQNKAGIQILKKLQDNESTASEKVRNAVKKMQDALSANIEHDFRTLIFQFGWTVDKETGRLCNIGDNDPTTKFKLNFTDFYARAREEAQRLDMDSNFLEYLELDFTGNPIMPADMGPVSQKLENIAQAIFNRKIARQTLPGWHAVQVTTVGYDNTLQYHPEIYVDINDPRKEITVEEYKALKEEDKDKYQKVAYVDALIPIWNSELEELVDSFTEKYNGDRNKAEQEVIDKLNKANLDKQIGYRIPTEGKQSTTILRIKGFLPRVYGSTIIVANEWVTQTGADFDIDTIYGIYHELRVVGENVFKITPNLETDEYNTKKRYVAYINEMLRNVNDATKDYIQTAKNARNIAYEAIEDAREHKKAFDELNKQRKSIFKELEPSDRKLINKSIKKFIDNKKISDINKDKRIIDRLNTLKLNDYKDNTKVIDIINKLIDIYNQRIELNQEYRDDNLSLFDKTEEGHNAFLTNADNEYFNTVIEIARGAGMITYEEFSKLDIISQQTRRARNNIIVDSMLEIMSDPTSREENYSRSNSDDLNESKDELNEIAGTGFSSASTYNPFDQLRFMQNAIDGRKLKAFSVNRDTFNSVNNKTHTKLNGNHAIKIAYDLSKYNKDLIESAFEEVEIDKEKNIAIVTHRSLGWSKNNRNVVGKLLTSYSSQTTAHILDAIKEGAIFNETDYTFGTFKTLLDVGTDYSTAIAFLMQPAITALNEYHNSATSIFNKNYDNPVYYYIKELAEKLNVSGINENSTYQDIIEAFSKDKNIQDKFKEIWNTEITEDLFDTEVIIDYNSLVNRLKDKTNSFDNYIFDLGITLAFNKYNRTTKNIETLSRCANPDSFGAKQTIRDTRLVVDNVIQHYSYSDYVGKTLVVGEHDSEYNFLKKYKNSKEISLEEQIENLETENEQLEKEYFEYSHPDKNIKGKERIEYISKSFDIDNKIKNNSAKLKELRKKLEEENNNIDNNIEEENNNENKSSIEYTTFLQKLYPGFGDKIISENNVEGKAEYRKVVDIKKSSYPYLASIFQYCTNKSIEVNKQMFDFESDEMNAVISYIESRFGRNFKKEEFVAFKKYMLSSIYTNLPYIHDRLTVNEHGQIVIDDNMFNDSEDFWDTEINRVYGYIEKISNFDVNDLSKPTPEELNDYLKLTPLQKVMFIKKHYVLGDNIFNYIDCTKFNKQELESKQYSKNRLTINTDGVDIEQLLLFFDEAFFNDDVFIKLAAVDLIKYAFVVEGFSFRRNSISRIITNNSLLADVQHGGLNLVNSFKGEIKEITQPNKLNDYLTDKFLRNFVRSHSDLITTINLDKNTESDNKINDNKLFLSTIRRDLGGIVFIPVQESYNKLLEKLNLDAESDSKYIQINYFPNEKKNTKKKVLYEIHRIITNEGNSIALIPLNYLDFNENYETSLNNDNHEFYSYGFYRDLINEKLGQPKTYNLSVEQAKIPKYKYNVNIDSSVDINTILNIATTNTGVTQAQAEKIIKDITKWYKSYGGVNSYGIISHDSQTLKKLFKNNNSIITQNIDVGDGIIVAFDIKQLPKQDSIFKLHKYFMEHGYFKDSTPKWMVDYHNNIVWNDATGKNPRLYRITIHKDDNFANKKAQEQNAIETEKKQYHASRIRYGEDFSNIDFEGFSNFDTIANLIVRDIEYKAHKGDKLADNIYEEFTTRGITTSSLKDISKRSNDIYYIAASYYTAVGNQLIQDLKNFEIDGTSYSINPNEKVDGKSLYDALREHPERREDFFNLLLKAKTFGDGVHEILELPITGEDPVLNNAINKIQKIINNVRNDNNLKIAFDAMFNYYLAKEYSENPNVRRGIIKLTDIFGDIDWWDTQFSDVAELNHKQIQVIVKMANDIVAEAHFEGLDRVEEFNKEYERILSENTGSFNIDNIVDKKEVRFINPVTKKFYEDRKAVYDKFRDISNKYGFHSKEYFLAELEKDKWLLDHTEQPIVREYYERDIELREELFKKALDYYVEYRQLLDKIYSNYIPYNQLTDAQKEERQRYWNRINELRGKTIDNEWDIFDDYGEVKDEIHKQNALDIYITRKANLNGEFFNQKETKEFREVLEYNLDIIDRYDSKHKLQTLEEKLENEEYRDAYEWIRGNARRVLKPEINHKLIQAYKALGNNDVAKKVFKKTLDAVPEKERYDVYGDIIGTKYTLEQQKAIRDLLEKKYHPYGELNDDGSISENTMNNLEDSKESDNGLLKEWPETSDDEPNFRDYVFSDEFYKTQVQSPEEQDNTVRKRKREIYTRINKIIEKGFDEKGRFSVTRLYDAYINEQGVFDSEPIKELGNLYQELRVINKSNYDNHDDESKKSSVKIRRNTTAISRNELELQNIPATYRSLFEKIIFDRKVNGDYSKKGKKRLGNRFLFGFYAPYKIEGKYPDKFVNKAKTEARKFLREQVKTVLTPYWYEAHRTAVAQGIEDEWIAANRVYNPYKREFEWLPIWTRTEVTPIGKESVYEFEAIGGHNKREIKEEKLNPLYKKGSSNYRTDDNTYKNEAYTNLTEKELKMIKFLQDTVNTYATNYKSKQFVNQGFLPRMRTIPVDAKWYVKQGLNALGLTTRNYNDREWHDIIDFSHDFDANFDMFQLIKGVGTRKHKEIPKMMYGEDEVEYKKLVEDIRKENEEIDKENLRIDNELANRNYKEVFNQMIYNGTEYLAKEKTKDLIYIMIEDLKSRNTTKVNNFGTLSRNRRVSRSDFDVYNETNQNNAYLVFTNWARRFLFKEYKNLSPLNRYSDLLQNITSAKFMIFNLLGGIANINTGIVNILGEGFANEFFSVKEWNKASKIYLSKSPKMIGDFFGTESNDFYVALTKYFDIVDYDQMLELAKDSDVVERNKKINRFLYSFQSGGEHYMQNSVLFAMLESHRLYKESNGKIQMVTFDQYNADVDIKAYEQVLRENDVELLDNFRFNLRRLDKNTQRQYDRFKRDPVADHIRSIQDNTLRNKILKEYNETRKTNTEIAKQEFNKMPTVMSQLELKDGRIRIKPIIVDNKEIPNDLLTDKQLGELKWKVQQVNDKIHGVYNKMGGARIEQYWFGNLVMQYHKHFYPGIMKRFRVNGMFNETRGTVDYGSYVSAFKLAANIAKDVFNPASQASYAETTEEDAIKSFSTFMTRVFDIGNIISFEWNLLPTWEKNNIMRCLGDLCGIGAAFLTAFAIYLMTDDDDLKDNNFIGSCLYLADRLLTESKMYTITGLYSEGATLWSSPIAGLSTIKDLFKTVELGTKYLIDPSFEVIYPNGLYKGKNKFGVIIQRNIPGWRIVKRIENIAKNNNYYRLNESTISTRLAKSIAESINPEDETIYNDDHNDW